MSDNIQTVPGAPEKSRRLRTFEEICEGDIENIINPPDIVRDLEGDFEDEIANIDIEEMDKDFERSYHTSYMDNEGCCRRNGMLYHYVATLNNYKEADVDHLDMLKETWDERGAITYGIYAREIGDKNKVPHLQCYFATKHGTSMYGLRDALGANAKGFTPTGCWWWLKFGRGMPSQAIKYCKKGPDWKEFGIVPEDGENKKSMQGRRQDIINFRNDCMSRKMRKRDVLMDDRYLPIYFNHQKACDTCMEELKPFRPMVDMRQPLRPWQQQLVDKCKLDPGDREIQFILDTGGLAGKSYVGHYIEAYFHPRVQKLDPGKRVDLAYQVKEEKDIFIFNVARGNMQYLSFPFLEMLKDRNITSLKYEGGEKKWYTNTRIIIFTNERIPDDVLTKDRYDIMRVSRLSM